MSESQTLTISGTGRTETVKQSKLFCQYAVLMLVSRGTYTFLTTWPVRHTVKERRSKL